MPKMRNSNAPTVLNKYLVCKKRGNQPRLSHKICEERCKKFKKCPYYGEWYREYYGKEVEEKPKPKPKRKKVVRRTRKKVKKKKSKAKVVKA